MSEHIKFLVLVHIESLASKIPDREPSSSLFPDEYQVLGIVEAKTLGHAYERVGEGLEYEVESGANGYMQINDGPALVFQPITTIESSADLSKRYENVRKKLLETSDYLPLEQAPLS